MSYDEKHILAAIVSGAKKSKINFMVRTIGLGITGTVACIVGGALSGGPVGIAIGAVASCGVGATTIAAATGQMLSLLQIVTNLSPSESTHLFDAVKGSMRQAGIESLQDLMKVISTPDKLTEVVTKTLQKFVTEELDFVYHEK